MKIDVLGFLKEGKLTYQQMADQLRLGITTINKQVKELKEEGKVGNNLKVTPLGDKELEDKRVKNVIILAAGGGSRMAPATDNTPKPLVKLLGKPMIETTIESLQAVGMNDITIVVGKLAERFDYLKEKYNVNLVFNNEGNKRNNIGSLEKVKDLLSNTLILEGDAPLYSKEIVLKYINDPLYYGAYHEGPTAEGSMKMRGNNILSIESGGEDQYIGKGGGYTNTESSHLYREGFDHNYDNPKFRDADAAYILIDILKEKNKHIRLYRINDSDMVECDTFEELCQVDPSHKGAYDA